MSQKTYLTILKAGIYLSFISVFLVFKSVLFPFITSKQIYFNILIELLFIVWLSFIIKYPAYRPKKSWISFGLIGFFIALILSLLTTVDLNLSFWGDIERMLGIFHLLHFLAFYFIIITVFRNSKDWRNLLIVSVAAAVLVCLYGQIKDINYSTIGNTAYVSGYAIFNIYFALILYFNSRDLIEDRRKKWWIGSLIFIAIFIMLLTFRLTRTRGAYVGLGISFFVMLFLFTILHKNKKVKSFSLSAFFIIAILISLVFAYPNSNIVKNNAILKTIPQISSKAVTFQTRLISWKAAIKDFPDHPILGTGHGNYAITFDKYFDPSFYNFTRSETYFDRAHNNLIDIASTTGIIGLLTYLSIFIAVAYYLTKGFRRGKIGRNVFILLTSLLVAYFIQNLAVFDSLVTYISLMVMLGFIYYLTSPELEEKPSDKTLDNKEIFTFLITGIVMVIIVFQYNVKPFKMLKGTIDGQIAFAQGNISGGVEIYKKALSYNTILDRDSRDSMVRAISSRVSALEKIKKEEARDILDYTIELAEENIKYNSKDSLMLMELAQILNITSRFYSDDENRFYFYSDRAVEAIDKSIESSPGRVPIYFIKAQILTTRRENDKAIETLEYAVSLNENYYDSYCNLARYQIAFNQEEEGFKAMDKCIDKGGASLLSPFNYVATLINHYAENEDVQRMLKLYQRLSQLEPGNGEVWVNLAMLYLKLNETDKAIEAAQKASEVDPSIKDASEEFIRNLEAQ